MATTLGVQVIQGHLQPWQPQQAGGPSNGLLTGFNASIAKIENDHSSCAMEGDENDEVIFIRQVTDLTRELVDLVAEEGDEEDEEEDRDDDDDSNGSSSDGFTDSEFDRHREDPDLIIIDLT